MYTRFLPLPVAPARRTLPPPLARSASIRWSACSVPACRRDAPVQARRLRAVAATVRRSPRRALRRDQGERAGRGRAVVVGEPESEVDERRRERLEHPLGRNGRDVGRRLGVGVHDDSAAAGVAERDRDDRALPHLVPDLVGEKPREGAGADDRVDGGEAGHGQRA
jgi:hypothetical protein